MPLSPRLAALFSDYAESHRNGVNLRLHVVAIPLIVFQIVAMLDWITLGHVPGTAFRVTLAHLAYLGAVGWYLTLDVPLGLGMAALFAACFPLAHATPRPAVIVVGVVAWGLQLMGHAVWEKRQPAFLHNLLHALVGPLFFVAKGVGRWPERPPAA
jgi:uncharacterized membrane protein YGL010W